MSSRPDLANLLMCGDFRGSVRRAPSGEWDDGDDPLDESPPETEN